MRFQIQIPGATKWMPNWKDNGWRTSSGEPVKNRADFEYLDSAMRDSNVNVKFVSVNGETYYTVSPTISKFRVGV